MKKPQDAHKLIAYMPFYGTGLPAIIRLASEKDAMVRKYCAMRQVSDEVENYISCRASVVLMRWDMRNMRPQEWDDETLRRQLWRVCVNARLDCLRRQSARKRMGLSLPVEGPAKKLRTVFRGPRSFCGVWGGNNKEATP